MLKGLLNIVQTIIPIAGDVVEQVKDSRSAEGGEGKFKITPRFIKQIIRMLVAVAAIYMFVTGKMGLEDVKEIIK